MALGAITENKMNYHIFIDYSKAREHLFRNIDEYSKIKTSRAKVKNANKNALEMIVGQEFNADHLFRVSFNDGRTFTKCVLMNRGIDLLAVMKGGSLNWASVNNALRNILLLHGSIDNISTILHSDRSSEINLMLLQAGMTPVTHLDDAFDALTKAREQMEVRYQLCRQNFLMKSGITMY